MIEKSSPSEVSGGVEIPFDASSLGSGTPLQFQPYGDFIHLDYQKPTMAGMIHLPDQAKAPELIIVPIIAAGPDCKQAKAGGKVLLMAKAMMGGEQGAILSGKRIYWTQEKFVVAILA